MEQVKRFQKGGIQNTRSRIYLSPVIKSYGSLFLEKFKQLYTVQVGIGHISYTNVMNNFLDNNLFYLINTERTENFTELLEFLRYHESYTTDYPYDDLIDGNLHVLVIKIPERFHGIVETFKASKYSKLYTSDQVDEVITKSTKAYKVITQNHKYKSRFESEVNNLYKDPHPKTYIQLLDDSELDYLVRLQEEYII